MNLCKGGQKVSARWPLLQYPRSVLERLLRPVTFARGLRLKHWSMVGLTLLLLHTTIVERCMGKFNVTEDEGICMQGNNI